MSAHDPTPAWKAVLATAVIFLVGAAAGVAADRVWLGRWPAPAEAATLTPEALTGALDLGPAQRARVQAVLDSLRVEMARAVAVGPDSLRTVARRGRQRLEDALPPDRRASFQEWMQDHHARMMEQMGTGVGAGMMGPGTGMGPGMMQRAPEATPDRAPERTPERGGAMMRGGMMGRDTSGGTIRR